MIIRFTAESGMVLYLEESILKGEYSVLFVSPRNMNFNNANKCFIRLIGKPLLRDIYSKIFH